MSYLAKNYHRPLPSIVRKYFASGEEHVDTWPASRLRAYQAEALRRILMHAYERNGFYREKFNAAGIVPARLDLPGELAKVPLTTKDEIRGKPWLLLSVPRHVVSQIHVSTGTTGGEEIYIPHTWEDLHVNNMSPAMRALIPVGESDVVVNALPYEMSSSGLAFHRTFQKSYGAMVVPMGKGGYYSTPERTLRAAADLGATVLITTPSYAVLLAEVAERMEIDLAELPLRFMWLTGEGCSPMLRERIEKLWGHPAYFYYGSLEAGPIGIECSARNGYHVAGGHVHVEVIDPTTRGGVASGEVGEIVVTELTRMASPLIRYRTGDIGYIETSRCSCGVTLDRLVLRGRAGDQIKVGEKTYGPYYLEQFLLEIPEVGNWYQFVPQGDRLLIRLEGNADASDQLARSIASRFEFSTGVKASVEFVESIVRTGGKTIRVIQSIP
ncbi:AMP-binding protein [Variovorax paradoxus]|uniref:phenylacetate--CoA ligase family protein n=1 Tax=Variovorax paradoxus TaxID=34073 RepID=UPI001ABC5FDA